MKYNNECTPNVIVIKQYPMILNDDNNFVVETIEENNKISQR